MEQDERRRKRERGVVFGTYEWKRRGKQGRTMINLENGSGV